MTGLAGLRFVRCMGRNTQGVDVSLHQVAKCLINQLMPLEGAHGTELLGYDVDAKVPAPVASPRMAGVEVAVVDQVDLFRLQPVLQTVTDAFQAGQVHDSDRERR